MCRSLGPRPGRRVEAVTHKSVDAALNVVKVDVIEIVRVGLVRRQIVSGADVNDRTSVATDHWITRAAVRAGRHVIMPVADQFVVTGQSIKDVDVGRGDARKASRQCPRSADVSDIAAIAAHYWAVAWTIGGERR